MPLSGNVLSNKRYCATTPHQRNLICWCWPIVFVTAVERTKRLPRVLMIYRAMILSGKLLVLESLHTVVYRTEQTTPSTWWM